MAVRLLVDLVWFLIGLSPLWGHSDATFSRHSKGRSHSNRSDRYPSCYLWNQTSKNHTAVVSHHRDNQYICLTWWHSKKGTLRVGYQGQQVKKKKKKFVTRALGKKNDIRSGDTKPAGQVRDLQAKGLPFPPIGTHERQSADPVRPLQVSQVRSIKDTSTF